MKSLIAALAAALCASSAWATTYTWIGASGDGNWANTNNWTVATSEEDATPVVPDTYPVNADDSAVISSAATIFSDVSIGISSITTVADVTLGAKLTGGAVVKAGAGTLTLVGVVAPTTSFTIEAGSVVVNNSLDGISPTVDVDATDTTTITTKEVTDEETQVTSTYVTGWASKVGDLSYTNDDSVATLTTDYFGGKNAVYLNNTTLASTFSDRSKVQTVFAVAHLVSKPSSNTGAILYRKNSSNTFIGQRNKNNSYWSVMVASSTNPKNGTYFWQNGANDSNYKTSDEIITTTQFYNGSAIQDYIGGNNAATKIAIGELIGLSTYNLSASAENRVMGKRVESYLGNKWAISGMQTMPTEIPVTVAAGATLSLPLGSKYTLGANTVATVGDSAITFTHKAAMIGETVYATVEDAFDAYEEGDTITICESTTLALTKAYSAMTISLAEGVELTIEQMAPYKTTYDSEAGTLTCVREAATFVYVGPESYTETAANFKIGDAVANDVPGENDTVQFDTATSLYIGTTADMPYAAFILNADLTVTGAGSKYLRVNKYSGTGKLILAGDGNLAPRAACTISCPLEIADGTENDIYIATSASNGTTIKGKMTGAGTLRLTYWKNDSYGGNTFACDGSEFYGMIVERQPSSVNAHRNCTNFSNVDFSNATVDLTGSYSGKSNLAFSFSNANSVIKFGSINGIICTGSSGAFTGHATIEVGNLNKDDTVSGDWMPHSDRTPNIRKVGTGTFTTSATDAYAYILNGGTLVVKAGAEATKGEPTTELEGYTVISTPNYDTDGATLLSTTYTLQAPKTNVAKIGDIEYETLAAAVTAATNGATIAVITNVELAARVDIGKSLTIDMGNYTIKPTATCGNGSVFNITAGNVTLKGGTLDGTAITQTAEQAAAYQSECDLVTVRSGATVTIESGTYKVNTRTGACVYPFNGGKATITGGTYTNEATEGEKMVLNQADVADQLVFVSGGTFSKSPADGDNSGKCTTFVAAGYESKVNADGTWTVTMIPTGSGAKIGDKDYASVEEAVTNATKGATVVIDGTGAQITDKVLAKVNTVTIQATVAVAKNISVGDGYCFAPTTSTATEGATGNAVLVKVPEFKSEPDTSKLATKGEVSMVIKNAKPHCTYYVNGAADVNGTYTLQAEYPDNDGQFTDGTATITIYYGTNKPSQMNYQVGVKSVND